MKTNNTKITIKNNKILLKEEGTKYGQLGMQAAKNLGKMAVDALKMVRATIKRAWGATFLYTWDVAFAIKKDGIDGIHKVNQEFHQKDKAIKSEQQQLIQSQPGNSDMKMFMSMACPAAMAFDKYVDTDFSNLRKGVQNKGRDIFKDKEDQFNSELAYSNIVMSISNLASNTPVTKNKSTYKKNRKRKVVITQEALDNVNSFEFIKMCKVIQSFYNQDEEDAKETFRIGKDAYDVLNLFVSKKSKKDIIDYMYNEQSSYSIDSLAKNLISGKKRKEYIRNKYNLFESYNHKSVKLLIENNKTYLKEEESKEKQSSKKIDAKSSMILSFASYYLSSIKILTTLFNIQSQKDAMILIISEKLLESLAKKENLGNDLNDLINKKIKEINDLSEKYNNSLDLMAEFKINLEKVENSDIEKFSKGVTKQLEMIKKSFDETDKADKNSKDIAYAKAMLDITEKSKDSIKDNDPELTKKEVYEGLEIINDYRKQLNIPEFVEVIEKYNNKLSQKGLDYNKIISDMTNSVKEIEEIFQKTESAYNAIKDFTSKESELESFIEKTTEEINQDAESPENSEDEDSEEQKGKHTRTKIVQLDSES
jgi:hypothetical protein